MWLKKARLATSIFSVVLVFGIFLFSVEKLDFLSRVILYPQFIPSLLNFVLVGGGLAASGFIAILFLTFVFGRVYCGWICPLGIFQDIIILVSSKIGKKIKRAYIKTTPWVNISVLGTAFVMLALGSMIVINLFEPYSIFGRFVTYIARPLAVACVNAASVLLSKIGIYAVAPKDYPELSVSLFIVTMVSFFAISVISFARGRIFCTALCPVGTILGFISRFSLWKIRLDPEKCSSCKSCERTCRASCINGETKTADTSRCVACFDCLESCGKDAISYARVPARKPAIDFARRKFLLGSIAGTGLLLGVTVPLRPFAKKILQQPPRFPSTPPGSIGVEHYTSGCTGCNLCVAQCPGRVIQPGFLEYGLRGFMQPYMNYGTGYCLYECNLCGKVCPAGAIRPLTVSDKQHVQVGKADFMREKCIVITDKENCAACAEHCPTHAVYTVPEGALNVPVTNTDICVGCGACEHVCPVRPDKAIVVSPLLVHVAALDPATVTPSSTESNKGKTETDDFPF